MSFALTAPQFRARLAPDEQLARRALALDLLQGPWPRKKLYRHSESADAHLARRIGNGAAISDGGCWMWRRGVNLKGYAIITIDRHTVHASRISWMVFVGGQMPPPGYDVCHRCDTPRCVNPDHLFLGTRSDNMKDCHAKGRSRIPGSRLPAVHMNGSKNGFAKLTEADIPIIRELRASGLLLREVAARFGISDDTVSMIAKRRTWGHVP